MFLNYIPINPIQNPLAGESVLMYETSLSLYHSVVLLSNRVGKFMPNFMHSFFAECQSQIAKLGSTSNV